MNLFAAADNRKGLLSLALCLGLMTSCMAAYAFDPYDTPANGLLISQNDSLPPLQGRVVTAPAGSFISATLTSPISSETARVGDRFMATLGTDLAAGGSIVLPAGSQLEAQVVSVVKAGRAGKNGQLDVRFTGAMLPNGQRVPLSGRIQTEDGTGVLKGGTGTGRLGNAALRTGVGAGLGAALGTAMGPLSGGSVGRGAVYGTAVGGGMGALAAAWQKGKDAVIPSGQPLNVILDQPLTVSPMSVVPAYAPPAPTYNTPAYSAPAYTPPPAYGSPAYPQQQPYNPYGQSYPTTPQNYGGGY